MVTSIANHYQISIREAFNFMKDNKRGIVEKDGERYTGFQPLLSWSLHLKSWSENTLYPTLIIKYEDLIIDTTSTFKKVLNFINDVTKSKKKIDEQKLLTCIENCKFSNLKKMENQNGFDESMIDKKTGNKITFFNLGKKNDFRNLLEKNLIDEMNEYFKYQLEKYKYII